MKRGDGMKLTETFLKEQEERLREEWHPVKNGELGFEKALTRGKGKKHWWLGICGHEWEARLFQRQQGTGCPYCKMRKVLVGFNDLATTHPHLANEWHSMKNEYLTPFHVSKGSGQIVWWHCEQGHEWKAKVGNRARGSKCPYCANKRKLGNQNEVGKGRKPRKSVISKTNNLTISHPKLASYWHPVKNGELTPQQVLKSSRQKVWWSCSCGYEWQISINASVRRFELSGIECLYCHKEAKKRRID